MNNILKQQFGIRKIFSRNNLMYSQKTKTNTGISKIMLKITFTIITFIMVFLGCQKNNSDLRPGLVGIYYSEPNLTSFKAITVLTSLEQNWNNQVDFQTGSSGIWDGYIIAPANGEISFYLETNKIANLEIGDDLKIESKQGLASINIKDVVLLKIKIKLVML